MISLEKLKILTPLQKLPKNVRDLGRLIIPMASKSCPKSKESPNLVTLEVTNCCFPVLDEFHLGNKSSSSEQKEGFFEKVKLCPTKKL